MDWIVGEPESHPSPVGAARRMMMRMSCCTFRLIAVGAIVLGTTVLAMGDVLHAAAHVDCDHANNRLIVSFVLVLPTEIRHPPTAGSDRLVVFWSLIDYSTQPSGGPDRVAGERVATKHCRLGDVDYTVVLRPVIPNVNLQGRCGAAITGSVEIRQGDAVVLTPLLFENRDCFLRDSHVSTVTVDGATGAVHVRRTADD